MLSGTGGNLCLRFFRKVEPLGSPGDAVVLPAERTLLDDEAIDTFFWGLIAVLLGMVAPAAAAVVLALLLPPPPAAPRDELPNAVLLVLLLVLFLLMLLLLDPRFVFVESDRSSPPFRDDCLELVDNDIGNGLMEIGPGLRLAIEVVSIRVGTTKVGSSSFRIATSVSCIVLQCSRPPSKSPRIFLAGLTVMASLMLASSALCSAFSFSFISLSVKALLLSLALVDVDDDDESLSLVLLSLFPVPVDVPPCC